jgi:hypothetical protein
MYTLSFFVQVFDLKTMDGRMDGYDVFSTAQQVQILLYITKNCIDRSLMMVIK